MNEYLDLIDPPQPDKADSANPYLDMVNEDHAIPAGVVRAVGDSNPDDVARQKRIASSLGVPLAAVETDPAFATREVKARAIEAASPLLRKKFTDADFAKLAHDDVDNLSAFEQAFTALKNTGNAAVSGLRSASAGAVGIARMPFDIINEIGRPMVDAGFMQSVPFKYTAKSLEDWQQEISGTAKAEMPKADGVMGSGFYSGISSLSRNLAALPMAFLPGGQGAALGAMVAPVGGEAYAQGREAGKSVGDSLTFATSQAAIEYATEKLPLSRLLGDLKQGTPFLKTLLHNAALEVPGEQIATVLQDLNEWAVINPDKPFADYIAERPNAAAQTLIATLVGTGGQVTVMEGISRAAGYAETRAAKAQQAERDTAGIEGINQLASASKVLQRDPDTFQSFVEAATEDGPVQAVYLDANVLMQSGLGQRLMADSPAVAEQIDRAIASGGQIAIPVAEYATNIAPKEYAGQLLDHLKTDAEGFSRFEAQAYMTEAANDMQAEIEQAIASSQTKDEFRASQDRVKQTVLDNLNTVGRFSPQKNELDATLIAARSAVRAQQLGMTPEEFFTKQVLKVQGERAGGQQFDQAGKLVTDTPEFSNWFGDSKVVDAEGKPLVVYHGTASDFTDFNPDSHFGTQPAANERANLFMRGRVIPVYLSINNPKRVQDQAKVKAGEWDDAIAQAKAEGYDGIVYRNEAEDAGKDSYIAFSPTQIKSAAGNRGTFDPTDPNILNQSASAPRGAYSPEQNIITLLNNADLSSFLHESAHYFFENDIALASELVQVPEPTAGEQRILDDVSALLTWHGIQGDLNEQLRQWHTMDFEEKRSHHERTAESFERYLLEGKAPSIELQSAFQTFRSWMISVYKSLKDFLGRNPEAGKLSDEVRGVFDRMLATDEQIALAEQGRSMMALFTEPLGMTPDEFATYQAQGKDATATAMDELQAKGLRDMQWMGNKRGKAIAKLQREAKALRAEAMLEARREVMSQPVYRAWDFLTRKQTAEDKLPPLERKSDPDILDPEIDSLFVAIAKLGGIKKDQVLSEWGIDPKDIPQSGLFGKPVWRITEGLTLDEMAQSLAHHNYLPTNEHGQYDLNDMADRFMAELAGEPQYSDAKKYDDLRPGEQIANPGGLGAGKLDLGALGSMGYDATQIELLKARRMTSGEGLHPDMAATVLDFDSGDEMVRSLMEAVPPKEAIAAMTDQIMLQRHGELATPEAIATAADMAIHNEVRARFITTEANALARAVGKPRLLAAAAKAFAAEQIARQKVRDLKPGLYTNAETKAAKGAEKAMKAGDTVQAAAEKRNQAINVYLARATYEAKDEVESGLRYLKRFDKPSKKIDAEYMDQIDAMLERFDLRKQSLKAIDKRASFAQWLAGQREQGIEPDVPEGLENEATRTNYKNLSVEEFRGLIDTVKQIEHLGRLKNKLLTAKDQREFSAIVDEVSASIIENGGPERPVELEQPGRFKELIENFRAGHRKLASLIRQMDGGKDGGPFWRVFVRGMNEAGTHEASMVEAATLRLMEIYQPMLALKGGLNGDKRFIPEINASLTRAGRLSIALNWGNETNRLRVMEGDQWSEYQVQAILNTMTRAEWQFVQDTWAFIDSYWPQIEAKEKRVTGRAPDKVQALPFTVMVNGENVALTGGYYPIKYDSNRDDRAEKHEAADIAEEMKRGAYTRASTRRGHTKARTESVRRPVKKTLDVITQHVGEVTHDLAWHEWLIDANRLLDAKPINQAIRSHYGTAVVRTMKDALTGIAAGDMARQTALDTALLYLRANVSRSTMGFSLTTAFLQPFGLLQSVARVGAKPIIHGIGRWAGDVAKMESTMKWVGAKSEFMRLRSKTFSRELNEIRNRVSKGHSKIRTVYDASLFMLMQKMQMVADIPTWIGVYDKAMADNMDEADAVALADQAVLDSQGGGQNKDLSEIQRKHPLMTMFYSYFNTTLNLVEESTAKTNFRDPLAVAGWASDMMLLMVVPALGPAMLLALMRGDACWEEGDCAREMVQAQLGYTLGTVVGVREMSGMAEGYDYAGPPVGRVIGELGRAGTQAKQGEMDEAAALAAVRLFGTALGIPTTQVIRSYRGWQAWADGDAPVTSILMGPPPKD